MIFIITGKLLFQNLRIRIFVFPYSDFMKKHLPRLRYPFLLVLVAGIALMAGLPEWKAHARKFHTAQEIAKFGQLRMDLPTDTTAWFAGSGKCAGCHGHDPAGFAFITPSGEDVNIADDWAGTMMAQASKDPYWRAKISHEILINPGAQDDIVNTCTRCHAPLGRFEAEYTNNLPYSMPSLLNDSLALDGVSCGACHQQKDTLFGRNFTGNLHFTKKIMFGPFVNPFTGPMNDFQNIGVQYGPHINNAGMCGGCHTLITDVHDLSGNPTGDKYVEQATYHEWLNSSYSDTFNSAARTCQNCHIPRITTPVDIATNYPFLQSRAPFGKHHLIGGNAFMLKLMRNNMTAVGATCTPTNFDTTIARTVRYLRDSTLEGNLYQAARTNDTVFYKVALRNKCGHKFPSGYPARRAYIEFVLMDNNGDTLFKSGMLDGNYNIIGQDAFIEPHYDVISDENQVQIYEMVPVDVNGNLTTVLERADSTYKDNRLAPLGFTNSHSAYDTCRIYGNALSDPDFNRTGIVQGTGADTVHYHIPLNGYSGNLNVTVRVYYQSIPQRWLSEMFASSTPEIDSFETMFNNADHTPMLVAEMLMGGLVTGTNMNELPALQITPNPTTDGLLRVKNYDKYDITAIRVYDLNGKLVDQLSPGKFDGLLQLPHRGVFIIRVETTTKKFTQKIIYH
jgi:hypothetical protein